MFRPFWIYTTISFFKKNFSPLPVCVCVKNTSYSQKKRKKKTFLANILNISKIESFEIYQDICIPTR